MIRTILALGIIGAVIYFGIAHTTSSITSFINVEAVVIVIVGCLAIFLFSNPMRVIASSLKLVGKEISGLNQKEIIKAREAILRVSEEIDQNVKPTETGIEILDRGLTWLDIGISEDDLESFIHEFCFHKISLLDDSASAISRLGKYPPALGMIGTVIGIVGIFANLNQKDAAAMIGPSLAVAMTATLYGLVFSNFFILPLAELIGQSVNKEERHLRICSEALRMWHKKNSALFIKEKMEIYEKAA
jgi:chemotaxis protein MotA